MARCGRSLRRPRRAIRCRPCVGRRSRPSGWPKSCPVKDMKFPGRRCAAVSTSSATRCKPTSKPRKARRLRDATSSSATSTGWPNGRCAPASRSCRSIPRRKNASESSKTPGRGGVPRVNRRRVNVFDYPSLAEGTAVPYGAYDVGRNEGFVSVGVSADTAEFAVEAIRSWWRLAGARHYPKATTLLVCADGGGSNGSRNRAWKLHLQTLADQTGLAVTVCHYPPFLCRDPLGVRSVDSRRALADRRRGYGRDRRSTRHPVARCGCRRPQDLRVCAEDPGSKAFR